LRHLIFVDRFDNITNLPNAGLDVEARWDRGRLARMGCAVCRDAGKMPAVPAALRLYTHYGIDLYTLECIMAFHVKDPATDAAVRRLAKLKGQTLTGAIREAVEHEYERERAKVPLAERIKEIQEEAAALSRPGGQPADKAFFDWLSGDE
jgi:antitoxin VapB